MIWCWSHGTFLNAIPSGVTGVGAEIDPKVVKLASENTGRKIIVGDFCTVPMDESPTLVLGNPPFRMSVVDRILNRAFDMLSASMQGDYRSA